MESEEIVTEQLDMICRHGDDNIAEADAMRERYRGLMRRIGSGNPDELSGFVSSLEWDLGHWSVDFIAEDLWFAAAIRTHGDGAARLRVEGDTVEDCLARLWLAAWGRLPQETKDVLLGERAPGGAPPFEAGDTA